MRIASFDGLRGVAALVVLLSHALNAAFPWYTEGVVEPAGSARWWISETPLHIVWAGPEMVIVFFVLSGYVLARPAVHQGLAWFRASYFPKRLIRLYLPALAAVLVAALLHELPAHHDVGAGFWLNSFSAPMTLAHGLQALTLTASIPQLTAFTTVLWSMRWEVVFSVLVPAAVVLPYLWRNRPRLSFTAAVACCLLAASTVPGTGWGSAPHYLAIFELGAIMSFQECRLPRIGHGRCATTIAGSLLCVCLLSAGYWSRLHVDAGVAVGAPELACLAGAGLAIWLAGHCDPLRSLLSSRVCQWLGSRSYSLYLVHQPIVVSTAFALGGRPNLLVLLITAVPASLVAADIFWRLVERQALQLSRRIGLSAPLPPPFRRAMASNRVSVELVPPPVPTRSEREIDAALGCPIHHNYQAFP